MHQLGLRPRQRVAEPAAVFAQALAIDQPAA
jgi:hypothetical protein